MPVAGTAKLPSTNKLSAMRTAPRRAFFPALSITLLITRSQIMAGILFFIPRCTNRGLQGPGALNASALAIRTSFLNSWLVGQERS